MKVKCFFVFFFLSYEGYLAWVEKVLCFPQTVNHPNKYNYYI